VPGQCGDCIDKPELCLGVGRLSIFGSDKRLLMYLATVRIGTAGPRREHTGRRAGGRGFNWKATPNRLIINPPAPETLTGQLMAVMEPQRLGLIRVNPCGLGRAIWESDWRDAELIDSLALSITEPLHVVKSVLNMGMHCS
jgi:hypothetical protein